MVHLETDHPEYGRVPLCGRADWSRLTRRNELNECWECASIEGHNWPINYKGDNDD